MAQFRFEFSERAGERADKLKAGESCAHSSTESERKQRQKRAQVAIKTITENALEVCFHFFGGRLVESCASRQRRKSALKRFVCEAARADLERFLARPTARVHSCHWAPQTNASQARWPIYICKQLKVQTANEVASEERDSRGAIDVQTVQQSARVNFSIDLASSPRCAHISKASSRERKKERKSCNFVDFRRNSFFLTRIVC